MVLLLSITCGVAVAVIYFPQAVIPLIAADLGIAPDHAALVATSTQLGYTAGLFLLVPLGDRLAYRPLLVTLLALTGVGLLVAGTASSPAVLVAAGAATGVTTVVPQIVIPMAAGLTSPERRGVVTGTLLSGLIGGILLARAFGGTLGAWLGWRAPYLVAAAVVLLLAAVLAVKVPLTTAPSRKPYRSLIAEPVRLLRTEPDLRRSCLYQACLFAGFSAAWTSITLFVTGPAFGLGTPMVGLIGLVGAGSMLCTPLAGRRVDRAGPDGVNLLSILGTALAAVVLLGGLARGAVGLAALAVGMLLLDIAVQCGQVANQARIFALRPEARSRLNTAYMTCSFLGGSAGSWLGVRAYHLLGWPGVCMLLALAVAPALGVWVSNERVARLA